MRQQIFGMALGIALVSSSLSMAAHHAFVAEFDPDQPIKLEGKVVRLELINPHSWIHLEIKGPDGTPEVWMIEAGAPNSLLRRGFTKDSLPPGTVIKVDGHRARDGARRANGWSLTYTDGRALFIGSPGTGSPNEKGSDVQP